jgi:hypothetical protein
MSIRIYSQTSPCTFISKKLIFKNAKGEISMDIHEIRRINLRSLIAERKLVDVAEIWGTSPSTLSQILGAGQNRNLGDALARKIEEKEGMIWGWLDQAPDNVSGRVLSERDAQRGKRLKRIFDQLKADEGLTQNALSAKIAALNPSEESGITQSMISQLLTGKVGLSTDTLLLIAKALQISPTVLDPGLSEFLSDGAMQTKPMKAICSISGSVFVDDHPPCPVPPSHQQRYAIAIDVDAYRSHFRKGSTLIASPEEAPAIDDLVYVYGARAEGPGLLSMLATLEGQEQGYLVLHDLLSGESIKIKEHPGLKVDPIISIHLPQVARTPR